MKQRPQKIENTRRRGRRLMAGHLLMVQLSGRICRWRRHGAVRGRVNNVGRAVHRTGQTILRRPLCPGLVRLNAVRLDAIAGRAIAGRAIPGGAIPSGAISCNWHPCSRRRDCGEPHGEHSQGCVNTSPAPRTLGSFSGGGGIRCRGGKLPVQCRLGFRTTRKTAQSHANLHHGYGGGDDRSKRIDLN
jgi:hypothetical protein